MFQVPAGIWKEIATYSQTGSRWAKAMAGGQEAISNLLDKVGKEQIAQGIPNRVSLAFHVTAPLLVENDAISEWAKATKSLSMLPDLPTPEIAAEVGALEYRLSPEQQTDLESLLSNELKGEAKASDERNGADDECLSNAALRSWLADPSVSLEEKLKTIGATSLRIVPEPRTLSRRRSDSTVAATDRWRKIKALNLPPKEQARAIKVAQRMTRQLIAARLKMGEKPKGE
jgi:hypothetical protein